MNGPQSYQPEWALSDFSNLEAIVRSQFAVQTLKVEQNMDDVAKAMENSLWNESFGRYDLSMNGVTSYLQPYGSMQMQDFGGSIDPMDLEFNKFIQVAT